METPDGERLRVTGDGWSLRELSDLLEGELDGPADLRVMGPAAAGADDPHGLTFAESPEFLKKAEASSVAAVLVTKDAASSSKPAIRVRSPREAFARFLDMCERPMPLAAGIHSTAVVSPSAEVASTASIGPYAVIEAGARIGERARVYPFAYVGESCSLGEDAVVYPHAVLYRDVQVGARSVIHAGAVLGADGFGFTWNGERQVKIPQVGGLVIGSDAEVGACTTVDRAMLGETRIGDGTKLDNLVQIGHNTVIGPHTVIAAQTGVGGSATVGDRCTLAGQVAVADHVNLGDDVTLTGRAAASKDMEGPGAFRGAPALPIGEQLRLEASQRRLPQMLERIRELEHRLAELEAKGEGG